jgi:hypothetical protein
VRLRERIEADPRLARELARFERTWASIADVPEDSRAPDLSARIVAELDSRAGQGKAFEAFTAWPLSVRLAATAALLLGTTLGFGVGRQLGDRARETGVEDVSEFETFGLQDSLAGSFWEEGTWPLESDEEENGLSNGQREELQ